MTTRIEKRILLRAPQERVWRALTDPTRFGTWFGVKLEGPFVPGKETFGKIVPTQVDPDVAIQQEPYRGVSLQVLVERLEPTSVFAFRWHPYAIDPACDYSQEPTTLVTFELQDVDGGTLLTITESGFEALPPERRVPAREANEGGWSHQARLIEKYLALEARP